MDHSEPTYPSLCLAKASWICLSHSGGVAPACTSSAPSRSSPVWFGLPDPIMAQPGPHIGYRGSHGPVYVSLRPD